ncbi:subtilase-type protease inhibitor [Streptomyces vinaceus]|uniref:subtilase-type protease inhibitor n=1 Tax=Streptomyces vinaceus TaxID=1960 RepID=UPI0037FE34D3
MRRRVKGLAVLTATVAAAASLAAVADSPAQAQPSGLYAPSALVLSVGSGDNAEAATVSRAVTLSCAPTPMGTHPASKSACAQLRSTAAAFDRLVRPAGLMECSMEWTPVTITADGVWQGKRVAWHYTFSNACEMRASLAGPVFAF